MKLIQFVYTKENGSQSNRDVIEVSAPNKYFEGIDVSELDQDGFEDFVHEYRELKEQQHKQTLSLMQKHDVANNYRRFLPERMSNVESEYV